MPLSSDRTGRWLFAIFFVSGAACLIYEVVFAKALALIFGSQAQATSTVLATYMAGLAIGSLIGGAISRRVVRPVRAYALCELGIALACAASPFTLQAVRAVYVAAALGSAPDAVAVGVLRAALGTLALFPPTLLMGMTLPLLTRATTSSARSLGSGVGFLYGANTLGAALGALGAGYLLLPALGVIRTTLVAVVLNLIAALGSRRLSETPAPEDGPASAASPQPRPARIGFTVLAIGGALTFVLETTYTHLLAVVAGNSAYAFALMLFAFLLGLGLGAIVLRGRVHAANAVSSVAALEIILAVSVLLGCRLWSQLPELFVRIGHWPMIAGSFAGRESFRALVCCVALVPPAACIGALYPAAMACVGMGDSRGGPGGLAGRAAALNTAGNVAGAMLCAFVLLPRLGSLRTLEVVAALALLLGAYAAASLVGRRRVLLLGSAAGVLALLLIQPRELDFDRLASGANVYFAPDDLRGKVIDHAESLDGGLTTVVESQRFGERVLTMRTNGKFQGDTGREVPAQIGFALDALLHVAARDRALVIGLGTGTTAEVLWESGFSHIDVVELSRDVIALADRHFQSTNLGVLHRAEVRVHVTDGRNFLLLSSERYDLIGIEVSSIWFAGAAALYNREFYRSARSHLTEGGVLQQWVQLHHIQVADVAAVIATVRAEFPKVWLYVGNGQAVIVACENDCAPRPATVERLETALALRPALQRLGGVSKMLGMRLLEPEGVERFLASWSARGLDVESLTSTDDNLLLEYATPRGNLLTFSMAPSLEAMAPFRPVSPLAGTQLR